MKYAVHINISDLWSVRKKWAKTKQIPKTSQSWNVLSDKKRAKRYFLRNKNLKNVFNDSGKYLVFVFFLHYEDVTILQLKPFSPSLSNYFLKCNKL